MAKAIKWVGILILTLSALLVLYVASYLALIQVEVHQTQFKGNPATWEMLTYRFGGEAAEWFFNPINQLDRRLRSKMWEAVNTPFSLEDFDELEPIEPVDQ